MNIENNMSAKVLKRYHLDRWRTGLRLSFRLFEDRPPRRPADFLIQDEAVETLGGVE